jgi:hypothetical protein
MKAKQKSWKQALEGVSKDLALFGSLCWAWFIVWRALRERRGVAL